MVAIIKPTITLIRLVLNNPGAFYPQDWYYDEEFAHRPDEPASLVTAVAIAREFLRRPQYWASGKGIGWLAQDYAWTTDADDEGNKVYVGGWSIGKLHKGFQIHRHLANLNIKELKW